MSMKRVMRLLAVVGVMAAMVVASALPAFADKGLKGHTTSETSGGDCETTTCQLTTTHSGRFEGGHGGGRYTESRAINRSQELETRDVSTQGGGKGIGGGNCTEHVDPNNTTSGGNGSRCN